MMKIVTVETLRAIEVEANASGYSYAQMMQHAGTAVGKAALRALSSAAADSEKRVTVLVGGGNNGGDGLIAGLYIAQNSNALVRFYLIKPRPTDDAPLQAVREAGLFLVNAADDQRFRVLTNVIASATLVIDAMFGIGVRLPLDTEAVKVLRAARQALAESETPIQDDDPTAIRLLHNETPPRIARPYVLALDCPSGLNCDTGAIDTNALPADETITFIAGKPGLFLQPGSASVGNLTFAPLAISQDISGLKDANIFVADAEYVQRILPVRSTDSHKGTFGRALIIGGSANYVGAPGLAARAAYRIGAGLVSVGAPAEAVGVLATSLMEATWLPLASEMGALTADGAALVREEAGRSQALLFGIGAGRERLTRDFLYTLLTAAGHAPRTLGFSVSLEGSPREVKPLPPMVIDADGLNLLGELENWPSLLPPMTILTPHPGEMARLCDVDSQTVQAQRWAIAREKAAAWNAIVLLKGANTLIAAPDGRMAVLPFKTSALAKAGTGDVLAGTIVGLLAQGLKPFEAAVAAGYLHGRAALRLLDAHNERSVLAHEIADYLFAPMR